MRRFAYTAGALPALLAGCALPGAVTPRHAEAPPAPVTASAPATPAAGAPTAAPEAAPAATSVAPTPAAAAPVPASTPSAPVPAKPAASASPAPPAPRPRAPAPAANAPSPPTTVAPAPVAAAAPATSRPPAGPPPLDLQTLEQRLRDTRAVGVFTKLSIKNQVDDLLTQFRSFHRGKVPPTLPDLRQKYEVLLLKVVTVVQDGDAPLAGAVASSREAIWGILSDPTKFASI
ncbi:MAG: hypothetical protein JSR73_14035 [Proteobacteria bacterium]|nr:hypothetical protein [Pseudomonadota bacterium]